MSSPFPLLRLPRLNLFDVFKSLDIGEKIKLSLCSKKISTEFNNARLYSQKVIVDLDILRRKIRVRSEYNEDIFDIVNCYYIGISRDTQHYQIGGRTVPVISFTKGINKYWRSQREGYLSAIRHLLKMFQCKILTDSSIDLEFKMLTIRPNGSKNQNLVWNQIFRELELVEDFSIASILPLDFKPVFTSWPQNITIMNSDWFTLEHLLACTCTRIRLLQSYLGNNDVDEVLRKWKAGGFPNLEYLNIHSQNIGTTETTILGMNFMELDGMVIQTDDGSKKATVKAKFRNIEMSVIPSE
ncbi:hypothetical protein GCK72_011129 [Caenorhabditis remanei]|uniref:F-box domain-containing protein n=1 Tax=Caenorhabditis remanei TaxID=31234 RepID=A0A6A5H7M4_CAERE|nr:hypothetical protein GCK72_011129 [Caenorhabditis remanei]KAF1762866.1 hypothetical protein GCK72_011129 [Caenorhabditis remanei]